MVTKPVTYRLDQETISRLSAWSFLLQMDKTAILKEAVETWEASRTPEERGKIDTILKQLQ